MPATKRRRPARARRSLFYRIGTLGLAWLAAAAAAAAAAASEAPSPEASPTATPTPRPRVEWGGASYEVPMEVLAEPAIRPDPDKDGYTYAQEPSVLLGLDGLLHMVYSGGSRGVEKLYVATSEDGLHWKKKPGPILGHGAGGFPGEVARGRQILLGDTYWVYFYGDGQIHRASSKDGLNYQTQGVVLKGNYFKDEGLCPYSLPYDSLGPVRDGDQWLGLVCLPREGHCLPWKTRKWNEWLFKSPDAVNWTLAHREPLDTLCSTSGDPFAAATLYCLRQMFKVNGHWVGFPFIAYPSNIWHSVSEDAIHWRTDARPLLPYTRHMFGLKECNQTADPDGFEFKGRFYLYFSAFDNLNVEGVIGIAAWPGSLKDYDRDSYRPPAAK